MKKLSTMILATGLILLCARPASAGELWGAGSPDWGAGASGPSPVVFKFDTSTGAVTPPLTFETSNWMWISGLADSGLYLYASHNTYDTDPGSYLDTHDFKIAKVNRYTGAVISDTSIAGYLGQTYSQVNALDFHDGKLYAVENASSGSTIRGYAIEVVLDGNGDVAGATLGAYIGPYPDAGLDYHDGLWYATSWGYTPSHKEGSLVFTSPDIMTTAFTQVGTGDSAVEGVGMIDGWEFDASGDLFAVTWYPVPSSATAVYGVDTNTWTATPLYDLSAQLPAEIVSLDALSDRVGACPDARYVATDGDDFSGYNDCTDSQTPCASIQHAIDVACPSGDTVSLAAGTYNEEVVIEKSLTVTGAGCGSTTVVGSTSTYPGGPFYTVFEVMADDVTIHDLSVETDWIAFQAHDPEWDGGDNAPDNFEVYNTCVSGGGQALDGWSPGTGLLFHDNTATGSVMNDVFWCGENAEIYNNTFSDSEQSSILLWDISAEGGYAPITTASIHDNVITGAQSCPARSTDYGVISIIDLDGTAGGSVSIADNTIADGYGAGIALQDCATNVSVTGNTITGQVDVWETDNGSQCVFGGTPDPAHVQAAHGIRVAGNNPGVVPVGVTISGNYVGETALGAAGANEGAGVYIDNPDGGTASVTGNVLANGAAGLVVAAGAWSLDADKNYLAANLDTGIDVNAASAGTLTCNRILGNDVGIVSANSGAAANDNTIAGNTTDGLDATAIAALPLMDATGNYWGCAGGANSPGCDSAVGNADVTPWAATEPLCVTCAGAGGDSDDDGVCDPIDNCVDSANADQADSDDDTLGDACDTCPLDADNDIDADTVCGDVDNCPDDPNTDQADADEDGIGDVCDDIELVGSITLSRVTLKTDNTKSSRLEGRVRISGVVVNAGDGAQFATDLTVNGDVVLDLSAGAYTASIELGLCEERANGRTIKCANGDVKALFKLIQQEGTFFPGDYTMSVKLGNHDAVDSPTGPVSVTLSQPTIAFDRIDDISACKANKKGTRLVCEER